MICQEHDLNVSLGTRTRDEVLQLMPFVAMPEYVVFLEEDKVILLAA